MAVPISITPFLASHLDKALETPSTHTIGPIFKILSGIGSHSLDALPLDLVARLQEQFKKLLQTVGTQQHMTDLFCLAVLAVMASSQSSSSTSQDKLPSRNTEHEASTVNQSRVCNEARQYLSKRAAKTLDLVVLKIIFVCSKSCTLTASEVIESLRLSQEIINAIDIADKRSWMVNDRGKLRKLVDKVSSYDRGSEVLCMLLLDETSIRDHLVALLQAANHEHGSSSDRLDTASALIVVESFTTSVECSPSLRHKLLYSLSTNALAEHLDHHLDLTQINRSNHGDHDNHCPYAYTQGRTRLQRKICTLFLKAALFSQQDTVGLDASLGSAMLDRLVALNADIPACRRYSQDCSSRKPAFVALLETESSPQSTAGSSQWRERIKRGLMQNAEHQYQTIVRTMQESCQDLETRCNDVERPLREEQAKVRRLHDIVEALNARIAEFEAHNHRQDLFLEGVEHEKAEFIEQVRSLENEVDSLSNQLERLRQELEGTAQRADDAAQNNTSTVKELEIAHAAVIAEKDEILESLHLHKLDLEATVDRLETSNAELSAKAIVTSNELAQLLTTLSDQRTALDIANRAIDEKDAECEKRNESTDRLQAEKRVLQDQLQEATGACRATEEERQAGLLKIEAQSVALVELRREYDTVLSAQKEKITQLHQLHDEQTEELQVYIAEQAKDAAKSAEESNKQLEKLAEEIENRENELEEARRLADQVVAFWNKPRVRNVPAGRRSILEPGASQGNPMDSNPPYQKHAVASSSIKTTPKAKRSRKHQRLDSPKPLSKNKNRLSVGATRTISAARGEATPFRPPLQDLKCGTTSAINVSPSRGRLHETTRKRSIDLEGHDENVNLEMTGVSLCDSDFFGSADQQLLVGVHGEMPQNTIDDTTVDF
ncbi:MAG: hypothetical protein Q9210_000919 [Variospora velana]